MSDTVNFADDEQHVELLPARTVLSTFSLQAPDGGSGSDGSDAVGTWGMNVAGIPIGPNAGNAMGADGASADGGS
jgi:hypothetical protein